MFLPLLFATLADRATPQTDSTPAARAEPTPIVATVRIIPDDTARPPIAFTALGAELRLDGTRPADGRLTRATPGELRVTKVADAFTSTLAAHATSGERLGAVLVEIPGERDTVRVRLAGAVVTAERLVLPVESPELQGQRLAQELSLTQLAADRDDAARQLAEAEAVADVEARDRRKLVPANALARARDQVRLLDARLATARRQLALLDARIARSRLATEELTIRADRTEIVRDR